MKKLISIVAPMYNEEKLVEAYCRETLAVAAQLEDRYTVEIILVNDGSRDGTYEKMLAQQAENPRELSVVCLTRNFGLEGAVSAGIRYARGDAVVVMDADLQDPPALIPEMIRKWEAGADVVVGSRIKRSSDGFLKRFTAAGYYRVLNSLSGKIRLEKSAANFRLLSRKALNQVLALPEVNSVFRVVVPFVGMHTDVVEYDRDKRYAGKTKYNLKSMISYALDSITGISVVPLRKIIWLEPLFAAWCIACILGLILGGVAWRRIWFLGLVLGVFCALITLALAVMAEYIAQIMLEVKGRPTSLVYEYRPGENAKEREET